MKKHNLISDHLEEHSVARRRMWLVCANADRWE